MRLDLTVRVGFGDSREVVVVAEGGATNVVVRGGDGVVGISGGCQRWWWSVPSLSGPDGNARFLNRFGAGFRLFSAGLAFLFFSFF